MAKTTAPKKIVETARQVATLTEDAYSVFAFKSWTGVALALLKDGFSPEEAGSVMRSKWVRWASDQVSGKATGADVVRWTKTDFPSRARMVRELADLVEQSEGCPGCNESDYPAFYAANPGLKSVVVPSGEVAVNIAALRRDGSPVSTVIFAPAGRPFLDGLTVVRRWAAETGVAPLVFAVVSTGRGCAKYVVRHGAVTEIK